MLASPDASSSAATFDFDRDVVAASRERPVLVDYWAPWCGPCQFLGPILETLARQADGAWTLVKINTEQHPTLAQREGIRGIPAVKLYVDGRVAGEFTGAMPETQLRRWLDDHIPSPDRARLDEARQLIASGDRGAAREALETVAAGGAAGEEARTLLARLVMIEDPERAAALLEGLEHLPEMEAARTLARFTRLAAADLPDAPARAEYLAASGDLAAGRLDDALTALIGVIQRDRYYDDDGARKAVVAVFLALGEEHPLVQTHRGTFNRSLY